MQSESIQRKQWREKAFCVNRLVRTAGASRRQYGLNKKNAAPLHKETKLD